MLTKDGRHLTLSPELWNHIYIYINFSHFPFTTWSSFTATNYFLLTYRKCCAQQIANKYAVKLNIKVALKYWKKPKWLFMHECILNIFYKVSLIVWWYWHDQVKCQERLLLPQNTNIKFVCEGNKIETRVTNLHELK